MRKMVLGPAASIVMAFAVPSQGAMYRPAKENPAIQLVFGTSYTEAQTAYENIERVYRDRRDGSGLPGHSRQGEPRCSSLKRA